MKRTIPFFLSLIVVILMSITANAQVLLNEQFDYPVGDSITAHGWTAHSGTTNIIYTVSGNLSYTGYCTPVGQKAAMTTSGQDVSRTFTAPTSGAFYIAFLVNITSAGTIGDYFLHLKDPGSSSSFTAKVYVKAGTAANTVFFGCSKAGTGSSPTAVYSTTSSDMNVTHLIVLKYNIVAGTANDEVSLFVDPATAAEGTATVIATDNTAADLAAFGSVALRQGTTANAAALTIDGIRVAATWADAIGFNGVVTAPTVITQGTTGITSTSAICGGDVTADNGGLIASRGICYGATANPDTLGTKVVVTGTTGVFTANLSGLTGGATYHYRAYAVNSAGVSYGNDSTFVTPVGAVAPVVTTGVASAVLEVTATVAGTVVNDGGATVTARGICWATTANPDTLASHSTETGTVGAFTSNLTGLTAATLYHARAYAINSVGVSYGADITFTTQIAGVAVANIAALRAQVADNSTVYKLTGEAFLTFKQAYKNEKFIQDTTGAIMIYDAVPATGVITTTYNIGDGITGIKGKLQNYYSQLEFIPYTDPGAATSTGHVTVPTVVTALNMYDSTYMHANHQSQLIKLVNVSFPEANGTLKFANSKKFLMAQTGATTDTLFYCNFFDADYNVTATAIPLPAGNGDVTGIAIWTKGRYYITARDKNDFAFPLGVSENEAGKIDIYPNPSEGLFNVKLSQGTLAEINVYSMTGEVVYRKTSNESFVTVDLSNQASGIFVMQVRDVKNGSSYSVKINKK
ncbi:MAG: T9SS type A sorting domain-containing protein [Bacteroidota bacterium]